MTIGSEIEIERVPFICSISLNAPKSVFFLAAFLALCRAV